jgi:1-acyl-sn-glycerol-3-phosphate acyltransferase
LISKKLKSIVKNAVIKNIKPDSFISLISSPAAIIGAIIGKILGDALPDDFLPQIINSILVGAAAGSFIEYSIKYEEKYKFKEADVQKAARETAVLYNNIRKELSDVNFSRKEAITYKTLAQNPITRNFVI